jgi:hypothetical protein
MAMFTPRNQLRNMLDWEASRTLLSNTTQPANLNRIIGLSSLLHQQQHHPQVQDNWLADSWLDDNWLDS